jgi:hypothetical protein
VNCKLTWLWLIPFLLLSFWLGAYGLNRDTIWEDERFSIVDAGGAPYALRDPLQIWNGVSNRNPWHAPGYFMLLNGWGRVAGWQPPVLRAFSLFAGMLAIAWTYRLGKDLMASRPALYGAAVMGISVFFVNYLHELRMYTLMALLTAYVIWVYWRVTQRPHPRWWHWAGFLAAAVTMLYIHYFATLPLATIGLYHLIFVKKDRRWWRVVGLLALAGVLFLPWLNVMLQGVNLVTENEELNAKALTPLETLERLAFTFSNGSLILFAGLLVLAVFYRQRGVWQVWFFALATLALVIMVNLILEVMYIGRLRYLIIMWPLAALVIGMGFAWLSRWRWVAPLALLLWTGIGFYNNLDWNFNVALQLNGIRGYRFPWHLTINDFLKHSQAGDALILNMPDDLGSVALRNQTLTEYYLGGSFIRATVAEPMQTAALQQQVEGTTMDFADQSLRVWNAFEIDDRPQYLPELESRLADHFEICPAPLLSSSVQFDLYVKSLICCEPSADAPGVVRFGEGITLHGFESLPAEISGETLPVVISWRIENRVPPHVYSVALHVLDENGSLVAQADYGLPTSSFSCQQSDISLAGLPPGDYSLHVIVYAWESGQRLSGEITATGVSGDRLPLDQFKRSE